MITIKMDKMKFAFVALLPLFVDSFNLVTINISHFSEIQIDMKEKQVERLLS